MAKKNNYWKLKEIILFKVRFYYAECKGYHVENNMRKYTDYKNCDLFVPPPPTIPPLFYKHNSITIIRNIHTQIVYPLAATPCNS